MKASSISKLKLPVPLRPLTSHESINLTESLGTTICRNTPNSDKLGFSPILATAMTQFACLMPLLKSHRPDNLYPPFVTLRFVDFGGPFDKTELVSVHIELASDCGINAAKVPNTLF